MRKLIILLLSLTFFACSNNEYVKTVKEGYVESDYRDILVKTVDKKSFYKNDYTKKFWQENIFLLLETEDKTKVYMGINYRGKDWLYMSSVEFVGDESFTIDFMDSKTFNPIWKDNVTISMGVEEKILFPLTEKDIESVEKIIGNKNVRIILRNAYNDEFHMRTLTEDESIRMKQILDLHKSIKEEKERKKDGN